MLFRLIRTWNGMEADGKAVPAINDNNSQRQIDQFLFGELLNAWWSTNTQLPSRGLAARHIHQELEITLHIREYMADFLEAGIFIGSQGWICCSSCLSGSSIARVLSYTPCSEALTVRVTKGGRS